MAQLLKTGQSRYEVLINGDSVGQVWNWHGSWAAQANGKTYHNHKSRKEAIARVEHIHRLR